MSEEKPNNDAPTIEISVELYKKLVKARVFTDASTV
jgi:hypothetical protein